MKIQFCAVALALASSGCVTGRVSEVGRDTYLVSASRCGICEPVQSYVTTIAAGYCAELGKAMLVRTMNGNYAQPLFPGSATLTFSCLAKDDPRYQELQLRKDDGVLTIEHR